ETNRKMKMPADTRPESSGTGEFPCNDSRAAAELSSEENNKMKIPSYLRSKYPVLCVAGLGGLLSVVNLACAQTWQATSAPAEFWTAVACSADGIKVVAVQDASYGGDGLIYTSTNSGANWRPTAAPSNYWSSVS